MKVNDIQPLFEAMVNVPKHWVKGISDVFRQPLIYAYASEFTDSLEEKQELLSELNFNPMGNIELISDIFNGKNKLYILNSNFTLNDTDDETFIDDTTVTLVAQYAPNTVTKGGYTLNGKHGNLLILNLAAFIADGKNLDDPKSEIEDMMRSMMDVVEHELVHLIQKSKGNASQLKKNKGYNLNAVGRNTEYFKSPVEFNAMITTIIRNIERKLDYLSTDEKQALGYDNILNGIQYALGDSSKRYKETGNKKIDYKAYQAFAKTFEQSGFMITLLDEKPNSWKRAVKAIMKHFENTLQ